MPIYTFTIEVGDFAPEGTHTEVCENAEVAVPRGPSNAWGLAMWR